MHFFVLIDVLFSSNIRNSKSFSSVWYFLFSLEFLYSILPYNEWSIENVVLFAYQSIHFQCTCFLLDFALSNTISVCSVTSTNVAAVPPVCKLDYIMEKLSLANQPYKITFPKKNIFSTSPSVLSNCPQKSHAITKCYKMKL